MGKLLIMLKWKYSRWVIKRRDISFKKMLCIMHWIQHLEKLPQYDIDKLRCLNYIKLRKMFIKEFPNEHLHNPYKD